MADALLDAPADIERAPRFDRSHNVKDFGSCDGLDVTLAKRGKNIALHLADDTSGMRLVELFGAICVPGTCYGLELPERIPAMLCRFLGVARVDALFDELFRFLPFLASDRRRDGRIFAQAEYFLLAGKSVFESPELRPLGRHEHEKPLAIEQFIFALAARRIFDFEILESHWGYFLLGVFRKNAPKIPPDQIAAGGFRRTMTDRNGGQRTPEIFDFIGR
ncbi:hypothetical protein HDC35_003222 [Sphingopyxis sp. JAI128]|nr:hypothetical protein [Sphingopyxis sp. JAI128]